MNTAALIIYLILNVAVIWFFVTQIFSPELKTFKFLRGELDRDYYINVSNIVVEYFNSYWKNYTHLLNMGEIETLELAVVYPNIRFSINNDIVMVKIKDIGFQLEEASKDGTSEMIIKQFCDIVNNEVSLDRKLEKLGL